MEGDVQAAFFGGSFTGIDEAEQINLLEAAYEFYKAGEISGIRVSTRPDYISEKILERLKKYHVTAIELGVQSMDISNDAVLLRISAEVAEKNIYSGQRALNRTLLLAFEDAGIPNPVAEVKLTRE